MKKLGTAIAAAAVVGVAVTGCSSSDSGDDSSTSSDGVVKAAIVTSGPVNDLGWNQAWSRAPRSSKPKDSWILR